MFTVMFIISKNHVYKCIHATRNSDSLQNSWIHILHALHSIQIDTYLVLPDTIQIIKKMIFVNYVSRERIETYKKYSVTGVEWNDTLVIIRNSCETSLWWMIYLEPIDLFCGEIFSFVYKSSLSISNMDIICWYTYHIGRWPKLITYIIRKKNNNKNNKGTTPFESPTTFCPSFPQLEPSVEDEIRIIINNW